MNQDQSLQVTLINHLMDELTVARVKNAIKIGKHLLTLKEGVGHGNWTNFAKENFGASLRSCEDYMRLAKNAIHPKHYKLGSYMLTRRLSAGEDLSS